MRDEPPQHVTVREFEAFQEHVVNTLKGFQSSLQDIANDNRDQIERLYRNTKPQPTLWLAVMSLVVTVIVAFGGLLGYGFNLELTHATEFLREAKADAMRDHGRFEAWNDFSIRRDLSELDARRAEERKNNLTLTKP